MQVKGTAGGSGPSETTGIADAASERRLLVGLLVVYLRGATGAKLVPAIRRLIERLVPAQARDATLARAIESRRGGTVVRVPELVDALQAHQPQLTQSELTAALAELKRADQAGPVIPTPSARRDTFAERPVLLPPVSRPLRHAGANPHPFEVAETVPRVGACREVLDSLGIVHDFHEGAAPKKSRRTQPYHAFVLPDRQTTLFICEQDGNASYICFGSTAWKALGKPSKQSLAKTPPPGVEVEVLPHSREGIDAWKSRLAELLTRPRETAAPTVPVEPNLGLLTREFLQREYIEGGRSTTDIGREAGVSGNTVGNYLRKHGLAARPKPVLSPETLALLTREFLEREYVEKGRTSEEIAASLGCSHVPILQRLRHFGIAVRPPRKPLAPEVEARLTRAYLKREYVDRERGTDQIAEDVGCSAWVVTERLEGFGIPLRPRGHPSSEQLRAKLTRAFLQAQYVEQGRTATQIADDVGCSATTVLNYLEEHGLPINPRMYPEVVWDLSAEFLRSEYLDKGRTLEAIAQDVGCGTSTIKRRMNVLGIPRRRSGTHARKPDVA